VERAIRDGVRYLKQQQRQDGSWPEVDERARSGATSLVTLALMTAGEKPDSPAIRAALEFLRKLGPNDLRWTYAIALQTMVFAAAEPERDLLRIAANVDWLERAQIRSGDPVPWPGSWSYDSKHNRQGDNSNTQYALLGLDAASEAGVPVRPEVWNRSRTYFEKAQHPDGGWGYTALDSPSTGSMTCAGISSRIITGLRGRQGQEFLRSAIRDCGRERSGRSPQSGIDWLANHFQVGQNYGHGQVWKYYYLYALERAGRLSGVRFFGSHDWYRLGAEELVHDQSKLSRFWRGAGLENELVATSFALLFLAKGRAPVLINKLRHLPANDWNNDPDDVRNLVGIISRNWKSLVVWQIVDSRTATAADLLQAPVLFFNGHQAPAFTLLEEKTLRESVEQGGFILADACCDKPEFDKGFKQLMKRMFPEKDESLRPLPPDHPIWKAKHPLDSTIHPLWGVQRGARTVVVYSPKDLSCYWNQAERSPTNPAVIQAIRVGQNVVEYATGHKLPPDKLSVRSGPR
jgi:hypothetical protein